VTEVGRVADASSGVAQYPVTIEFATDDAAFSIGTSITGSISTTVKDDVIQVPVRAVTTGNGESTVRVALDGKTDGRTEARTVTIGESAGGQMEITDGLEEGEQVIVESVVITGGGGNDGGTQLPGGGQLPDRVFVPGNGQIPSGAQAGR
jgi:macrolide-specific efflux system membrane fusion protein